MKPVDAPPPTNVERVGNAPPRVDLALLVTSGLVDLIVVVEI